MNAATHIMRQHGELAAYFQKADYADIKCIEGEIGLRAFVGGMLSYYPGWIVLLYRVRELLVRLLGLVRHARPDTLPSIAPEDLAFTPGQRASFFVVRDAKEDTYWVSETPRDNHLSAYFGVVAEPLGDRLTRYHVFTTVQYIHWTGPVYFNLIRPFHHVVVSSMMRAAIKSHTGT